MKGKVPSAESELGTLRTWRDVTKHVGQHANDSAISPVQLNVTNLDLFKYIDIGSHIQLESSTQQMKRRDKLSVNK